MASARYQGRSLPHPEDDINDQGLAFDLQTLLDRRRMLKLMGYSGIAAALFAAGCGPSSGEPQGVLSPTSAAGGGTSTADCVAIPEETAGPFPGDGSNGPDVLSQSGIVRRDIRPSFGDLSGTADGVPLTIQIAVRNASNSCAPPAGAAVYAWHCDRAGQYSLYTITDQNYLRGVQ
jgi:protocatechuate 3,4-dioxygenase beta subunit